MNKLIKGFLLIIFSLCYCALSNAQVKQWGAQIGYTNGKLLPKKNILTEQLFVREGRSVSGFTIGGNFTLAKPKDQVKKGLDLRYKILLESNLCRCGGNLTVTTTNLDGTRNFSDLKYLFYIFDFSPKFVVQSKNLSLLVGPIINRIFYAGYTIDSGDKLYSATGDFSTNSIGYELGFGYQISKVNLSLRTLGIVTDFGNSLARNQLDIGYRQIRLTLAMVLFEKDRAKNWDSIIWK